MKRRIPRSWLAVLAGAALACGPAAAQDASDFVVRLNRLEGQVRTLSGQVEQQQFENRQLKEQLRKFQEDTEFRFQERSQERSGGPRGGTAPSAQPSATPSTPGQGRPGRRSDAFDADTSPAAPGAPRTLGGAPETGRVAAGNPDPRAIGGNPDAPRAVAAPRPSGGGIASIIDEEGARPAGAPSVAATGSDSARADYDAAYASFTGKQYEQAEMGFRRFIQSHPRDRLVADATYWLGESYLQRNRSREAAEQFLKISTDYSRSPKAPDALLKLGMSLSALGAKDQACATFAELERKYPAASSSVKQGVDREQKRARCPA